jgi:hypothetical protein
MDLNPYLNTCLICLVKDCYLSRGPPLTVVKCELAVVRCLMYLAKPPTDPMAKRRFSRSVGQRVS